MTRKATAAPCFELLVRTAELHVWGGVLAPMVRACEDRLRAEDVPQSDHARLIAEVLADCFHEPLLVDAIAEALMKVRSVRRAAGLRVG